MKAFITLPKNAVFPTFFTDENIALAESLGEVIWNDKTVQLTPDEIAEGIKDSDVYVTGWGSPRLDARILDAAPNLKLLVHLCGTVVPFVSDELWEQAKRLIRETKYSFFEISEMLMLSNSHYFSTLFKTYVGMTPTEYKQSCK